MSIRYKIFLAFAFLFLFALAVLIRIGEKELLPRYNEAVEDTLSDFAYILAPLIAENAWDHKTNSLSSDKIRALFIAADIPLNAQIHNKQKFIVEAHYYVTDNKGHLIFDSQYSDRKGTDYSQWNDVYRTLRGQYGARATRQIADDPISTTLYSAAPIKRGNEIVGVISMGKPVRGFRNFLILAQSRMYIGASLVALVGLIISMFVAYKITKPLETLRKYILSLTTARPLPTPIASKDEIGALTKSFLEMKTQLEAKEYVETYVTQLTHEIKSPISAILGAAEILKDSKQNNFSDQLMSNIYLEGKRLQSIAEKLLEIASLEKREEQLKTEIFDIRLLFDEIIDSFYVSIQKKNLNILIEVPEALALKAERFLIWRAFSNLVQNAIEFSPSDSTLTLIAENTAKKTTLTVMDEGPGIPSFAENKLFEKFFSLERPDTGRKGTGLGLVFAKTVFEKHNGTIQIGNRITGGCYAIVTLPSAL
jgi:two-component system, OmpR family, sensor histidine kinase CreC